MWYTIYVKEKNTESIESRSFAMIGFPPQIWKKVHWLSLAFSLTWTQISLTIFGILREVLPGEWNDNRNIFKMNITIYYNFMIFIISKKVPWPSLTFLKKKKVSQLSLTTLFFHNFPDFPAQWEPCTKTNMSIKTPTHNAWQECVILWIWIFFFFK